MKRFIGTNRLILHRHQNQRMYMCLRSMLQRHFQQEFMALQNKPWLYWAMATGIDPKDLTQDLRVRGNMRQRLSLSSICRHRRHHRPQIPSAVRPSSCASSAFYVATPKDSFPKPCGAADRVSLWPGHLRPARSRKWSYNRTVQNELTCLTSTQLAAATRFRHLEPSRLS